jgi:hypothetical protein
MHSLERVKEKGDYRIESREEQGIGKMEGSEKEEGRKKKKEGRKKEGFMKIRIQTPLGEVEFYSRRLPDGRIGWSQMPRPSKRARSEKQQIQMRRFREAARYARSAARTLRIYTDLAAKFPRTSAYSLAIADWFHPPEILDVELSEWSSEGKIICAFVVDNVQVKSVHVAITDPSGTVLEQGPATLENYDWWIYQTSVPACDNLQVIVTAEDLPGHITEVRKSRN